MPQPRNLITDVAGLTVGNAVDSRVITGVTVLIAEGAAIAAVDVRGGGPGTRETDALGLSGTVDAVHAIVLSGGSAFGLDSPSGVQAYMREQGRGFRRRILRQREGERDVEHAVAHHHDFHRADLVRDRRGRRACIRGDGNGAEPSEEGAAVHSEIGGEVRRQLHHAKMSATMPLYQPIFSSCVCLRSSGLSPVLEMKVSTANSLPSLGS